MFGMGTGVSTTVWSPEKLGGRSDPPELDVLDFELEWSELRYQFAAQLTWISMPSRLIGERLINVAKRSSVSTG